MRFGEFARGLRSKKQITLRQFCIQYGHDPSNWSKIERGDLPPTENRETLETWAEQLGLQKGTDDWFKFFDLAFQERGKIPSDLLTDQELVDALPLFFRTFRGTKPSEQELDKMIELLRRR